MDTIINLTEIVQREVEDYAGPGYKITTYPITDTQRQIYAVIVVTDVDYPLEQSREVVIMARVVDDHVVIEQDITDKPLWQELVREGIPRERIVCTYAGETLPVKSDG